MIDLLSEAYRGDEVLFARAGGFKPDEWQEEYLRARDRRIILLIHRQGGKTGATAWKVLHRAVYEPGSLILMTASAGRQSSEAFQRVRDILTDIKQPFEVTEESFPPDIPELAEDKKLSLVLANRSRIVALPCKASSVRSFSRVAIVVVDEAAFVPTEFYTAVSPMLGISSGQMLVMSTPKGKQNRFYELWVTEKNGYRRFFRMAPQCARLTKEFLESEKATMTDRDFRQEYMCEFTESSASVFTEEDIQAMASDEVEPLFPGGLAPTGEPPLLPLEHKRKPIEIKPLMAGTTVEDMWSDDS